jgi:hypothetical protein
MSRFSLTALAFQKLYKISLFNNPVLGSKRSHCDAGY